MLTVIDHALIRHKLAILRNTNTSTKEYRRTTNELALLLAYPLFDKLALQKKFIETPMERTEVATLGLYAPCLVSILRAGNGLLEPLCQVFPEAVVGFVGIARHPETHLPEEYYCNLPADLGKREVFVVDPMLATGGSAIDAIGQIKKAGAKKIRFLCIIAAPEGVKALQKAHPDVDIITAALDRELNINKYILPGLGDAGDRYYGTD